MQKALIMVGLVVVGIIATGLFLNEAGKGTFGGVVKDLAKNITNGYGDAAAAI